MRSSAAGLDVADGHVVVARVDEEPGDHAADFAGAEQQDAVHDVSHYGSRDGRCQLFRPAGLWS